VGGRGKPCERCAWETASLKEYSLAAGVSSVLVAGDLSKFYERIGHQKLIDEAAAVGYPLRLLKMNIAAYRGPRRCRLGGACSREVRASGSVGAGCSHAHAVIKAFTLRALVKLQALNPTAKVRAICDDVSGQLHARQNRDAAPRVLKYMTDYRRIFEEELGQVVNLKKSVVAADDGPTADHLTKSLQGTGVTVVPTTKLIGVGITTSRHHGRQVARARFRKAARRRRRFYALLAAGAYTPRVTACGTNKARLWGPLCWACPTPTCGG
jgi:hypothetical protein